MKIVILSDIITYMFIRCMFNNIYSFGKEMEFNMIPAPRFSRLKGHKYQKKGIELLKMASIYGANGAGKSNLIRSLAFLRDIVVSGDLPSPMALRRMKHFHSVEAPTVLAVEFISSDIPYIYALEIGEQAVLKEELYISGLGVNEDKLVFERLTVEGNKTALKFLDAFTKNEEGKVLKGILENNLIKPNKTSLKIISELENPLLADVNRAFEWFGSKLVIITPNMRSGGLAHRIDVDEEFHRYAEQIMCTFSVGIKKILTVKKPFEEFFGDDNKADKEKLLNRMAENPNAILGLFKGNGEEFVVVEENGGVVVKQLKTEHTAKDGRSVMFDLSEESDGSVRLMDYLPAFKDLLTKDITYFIDEIERSIHPLLIKEIIGKFSADDNSKGQLICTTHESNLLDQEIFRQDEIWFVEKDTSGSTDMYSLCDFKEHNTTDIRKGYLSGRYGSIPFLSNLKDLNWDKYDFKK
ncbi:MAG: ATP-binding protein [Sphaerochaeta sp.]|nr:ATP-binding protein [Sphaerochaeta sp.]